MKFVLTILTLLLTTDSDEWQVAANDGPKPRYINQIAYSEDRLILFGGKNSSNKGFDDFWGWKDGHWNALGNGSTKRWDHSYVYMEDHQQLFIFVGRAFTEVNGNEERIYLNDNWIYKNGQWEQLQIASPDTRSAHSMAFFKGNGHVILFGGFDGESLHNGLWAFDGEEWREIETKDKPSPRMAHAMHFDDRGNAILFGGWDDSGNVSGELWSWIDGRWQRLHTEKKPRGRLSCAITYAPTHQEFILFGGSTGFGGEFLPETWKFRRTKNKQH